MCETQEYVHSAAVTSLNYFKLLYVRQHAARICNPVAWSLEVTSRPCKANNQLSCSTSSIYFFFRDFTWVYTNHAACIEHCLLYQSSHTLGFPTPCSLSCKFISVFTQCNVETPKWMIIYFTSVCFCVWDWLQWIWATGESTIFLIQPKALQSLGIAEIADGTV